MNNRKNKRKGLSVVDVIRRDWQLYLLILPGFIVMFLFKIIPLYGLQIAFKDFNISTGYWDSAWVGFKHFIRFFEGYNFFKLLGNTFVISFLGLVIAYPVPIILSLCLNAMKKKGLSKFYQTGFLMPHFISMAVAVGIIYTMFSPQYGVINFIIKALGGEAISFMGVVEWLRPLYIGSNIWQSAGYTSIVYMGALATVDPQLHEAAIVEGASRFQRMLIIDLETIKPMAVAMLVLNFGRMASVGAQKMLLMQTPANLEVSEIVSTYVYKMGLVNAQYSFATAVGLFETVINITLLVLVNAFAKKAANQSLF